MRLERRKSQAVLSGETPKGPVLGVRNPNAHHMLERNARERIAFRLVVLVAAGVRVDGRALVLVVVRVGIGIDVCG